MLTAFTAGLLLITVSELGDKSFFIAVILSMRHSRRWVFSGVVAALAAMTILSVWIGQVATLLPEHYIHYSAIALFIGFGIKLLYDASQMSPTEEREEAEEAAAAVNQSEAKLSTSKLGTVRAIVPTVLQAFSLTFLAEWGDRTQFATIALAASYQPIGVGIGAILGHGICTAIAVIGGRLLAGRISEKTLTFIGGGLFLVFGIIAIIEP
jgi:putative Ca2+/H+ antiporter (TMEM165/GDT1 family)